MLQKFLFAFSIFVSAGLIWFALNLGNTSTPVSTDQVSAIREEQGIQIIHILARGGYSPRQIVAKAGIPTVLEIETKGTYDCSAALRIPKLNYQESLPSTGITKVTVPEGLARDTLDGVCAMGMYSFQVRFEG